MTRRLQLLVLGLALASIAAYACHRHMRSAVRHGQDRGRAASGCTPGAASCCKSMELETVEAATDAPASEPLAA